MSLVQLEGDEEGEQAVRQQKGKANDVPLVELVVDLNELGALVGLDGVPRGRVGGGPLHLKGGKNENSSNGIRCSPVGPRARRVRYQLAPTTTLPIIT